MVETSEQIRPLAPASERPTSSDDEAAATPVNHRRRRLLRCCACVGAVLLIQAVVIVILIFTVFKVKDPVADPGIYIRGCESYDKSLYNIPKIKTNTKIMTAYVIPIIPHLNYRYLPRFFLLKTQTILSLSEFIFKYIILLKKNLGVHSYPHCPLSLRHWKDPVIRLNGVTVDRLDLINGTTTPQPGSNMSLTADVSVQNPNYASFRYPEMTSSLYYRGTEIGEARGPAGKARARRTARMNVTVEVIADRVTGQPELGSDINSGMLTLGSYTVVGGKVKILMVKKHDRITMNCSLTVNEETIKG
ncbi:hypothetical protein SASPL_123834 [Salvia splendens]|uniref:Late embryogenesis abundant protein LEA-2 subgroup domain-containing protein n=1 Tax=Salvia splendens TaxID=180675 RepID=A0A8X8XNX8_SALSN|nr:hypothetical protein SASPL_123834 [Salvia splendens]